jgi:para-nitrobenzyl esterase
MSGHCFNKSRLAFPMALLLGCAMLTAGVIGSTMSKAQGADGPIVNVSGGKIQGRFLPADAGAVFKGVPYGGSTAGEQRWAETQPVIPWTGVRQAAQFGAPCAQAPGPSERAKALAAASSEDCLFLNVWTPKWSPKAKLPVMVWLYGGDLSNASGEGNMYLSPVYDGTHLTRHGVIAITINYRMGLFGLVGHPELNAESPHHASANFSMLDQVAALKWVHDNIARFGGDPGNVTLFGQSGGARFTGMLLTSPLTKGLIHRAILMSDKNIPGTWPYGTPKDEEQSGIALAGALNAPATSQIKYLRSVPASQIAAAGREVSKRLTQHDYFSFDQGIDGYVVPKDPIEVYHDHKELPVPIMEGSTSLDATRVVDLASPRVSDNATPAEKRAAMKNILGIFYGKYPDLLARAEKIYGVNGGPNQLSTNPAYGDPDIQLAVDFNHRCGEVTTALWHSKLAPTYHYEFTRSTPGHPPVHESDVRFVWDGLGDESSDGSARKLADTIERYWTNFAKTGNPNGPGLPEWPKYDASRKPYMDFTNDGAVQKMAMQDAACQVYVEKFRRDPLAMHGKSFRLAPNYIQ